MLTCIVICSTSVFPLHYCQTVDPVCSASQCNLTQGNQLFFCKKMIQRPFCLGCMIDFSLLQSLKQIRRLNVDQFYLICLIKNPVRNPFPDPDSRNASDLVIEAFQMLDI